MGQVSLAWAAIDEWIEQLAPGSAQIRRWPATPGRIATAEQALGLGLPADFVESLGRHDGQPKGCTDFPRYPLLSLADIVSTRQMLVEVADTPGDPGADRT